MIKYNIDKLRGLYRYVLQTLLNEVKPEAEEWSIVFSVTVYVKDGRLMGKAGTATLHTFAGRNAENLDRALDTLEIKLNKSGEWEIPNEKLQT